MEFRWNFRHNDITIEIETPPLTALTLKKKRHLSILLM